jgi:hypothetical protein
METSKPDIDYATHALEACVAHGRNVLAVQLPDVESKNFDFAPSIKELTIQLFLVGVMWRFGEQFELPTDARDRAFICLMSILIKDGMSLKAAKRKIAELNESSRSTDGKDVLPVTIGYEAGTKEGALVAVFDQYREHPALSAAPYRVIDRSKPIAIILTISGASIAALLGRSLAESLGVGIVLGISTIAIAFTIYKQMVKSRSSSNR